MVHKVIVLDREAPRVTSHEVDDERPDGPAWLVDERVQWHDASPGVVRVSFIRRHPSLTPDEFARHWSEVHTPIARRRHPGICRYVQNVVIRPLTDDAPDWDGIAMLGFATHHDLEHRMYDSPEGKETVAADVRRFIDLPAGERYLFEP